MFARRGSSSPLGAVIVENARTFLAAMLQGEEAVVR